ncbi:AMP-binding protein [Amycolatopsis sp. NPDC005232]|uniref:class I adenylate-forming enzyme family protein n=1 Tax=Amycolatopsis sp. NPDC005232 TaxID=3157027 RepID=UPI0033B976EF
MRRAVEFNSDRVAVMSEGRSLTYAEAWDRGKRMANALASLGVRPGDRVAVLEDNCMASSDFFVGTAIGNFVRVPLYKRNSSEAHAHMLRQTQCKVLVVAADLESEVKDLVATLPDLDHIIVRDAGYEDWLASFPCTDPDPAIDVDDFYVIRHSAGTTGLSKGVAFTHRAWMNTERNWTFLLAPIGIGDCSVHVGPISHGSGYLFVPTWLAGGTNILEPRFSPQRVLALLSEHGGYIFGVPTMLSDLVKAIDTGEVTLPALPALKGFVLGGAPINRATTLRAKELLDGKLYQMFGQTECVPGTWLTPGDWFADIEGSDPVVSCGRVLPYTEVEIRDANNKPLPIGETGEIALRSDGQMVCIWGEPDLTAQRLVDGWVLTGDIGHFDRNGYLYLADRKDDLIISGGFNIWPAELEAVIAELPGVREVSVVGIPSERWGETPLALIVVDSLGAVTEEAVVETCRKRLGSYKKPSRVEFSTEPLRRTPLGKISRKLLREPYWAGRANRVGSA